MKRKRSINYTTLINDDNNDLYLLLNNYYLDIQSLLQLSLVNKLFRLFSLFSIRNIIKLRTTTTYYTHFLIHKTLDNMINRCFFNQMFITLYQQLYITKEEEFKFTKKFKELYKEGDENDIRLFNVIT